MRCSSPIYKLCFFVLFTIFILLGRNLCVNAASMTDVRIGLKDLYSGKSIITVYNTDISIGFCTDTSYKAEIAFISAGGFSFEPDFGNYLKANKDYSSYSLCLSDAEKLKKEGAEAYPVYVESAKWQIYVTKKDYQSNSDKIISYLNTDLTEIKDTSALISCTFDSGKFLINGKEADQFPQIKSNSSSGTISVCLGTRSYRGRIEIGRYNGEKSLKAVNIVNIEAYLLGVVPCEMSSSYGLEALKAQAVCARSYCVANAGYKIKGSVSNPYSISDTATSQVYKGVNVENARTSKAVKQTYGIVIRDTENIVIPTYYFSTSGGHTDSIMDIWGYSSNIYKSVFDRYETSPEKKPWIKKYTLEDFSKHLSDNGFSVGNVQKIISEIITEGGRIYSVTVVGDKGKAVVSGQKLKKIFGLPDIKCKLVMHGTDADSFYIATSRETVQAKAKDTYVITADGTSKLSATGLEQYIVISNNNLTNFLDNTPEEGYIWFAGMGNGHGIGMSQSGAAGMADAGYNYKEILHFYYKNIRIGR